MIRQVIDAAPRPADARATGKGSGAMDKREILTSLIAAAAFTALLAHGFKTVRAAMPVGAHVAADACERDAVARLPCPPEPPRR
jgi:hypothetical protein